MPTPKPFQWNRDRGGWYTPPVESNAKTVYVSAAGHDSNDGTEGRPFRTPKRAFAAIGESKVQGRILFNAGDRWGEGLSIPFNGKAKDAPLIVGAYGDIAAKGRPQFRPYSQHGVATNGKANLAILDLHLRADRRAPGDANFDGRNPIDGVSCLNSANVALIGNLIEFFRMNIVAQDTVGNDRSATNYATDNLLIARNVVCESHSVTTHSNGAYVHRYRNVEVCENVLDHNGWIGELPKPITKPTMYNQNVYITGENWNVSAWGNVSANAAATGFQHRCGGDHFGNLYLMNPVGFTWGLVNGDGPQDTDGVEGEVYANVVIGGRELWDNEKYAKRGIGTSAANMFRAHWHDILWANDTQGVLPALSFEKPDGVYEGRTVGVQNFLGERLIAYNWKHGVYVEPQLDGNGPSRQFKNNTLRDCVFPTSEGRAGEIKMERVVVSRGDYPDPKRANVNVKALMAMCRQQFRAKWRDDISGLMATAFILEGFGLRGAVKVNPTPEPGPVDPPPPPPPPDPVEPVSVEVGVYATTPDMKVIGKVDEGAKLRDGVFALRADPSKSVEKLVFFLNGVEIKTEQSAPYYAHGDASGKATPSGLKPGEYTLAVVPYVGGKPVRGTTVNFSVIERGEPSPTPVMNVPEALRKLDAAAATASSIELQLRGALTGGGIPEAPARQVEAARQQAGQVTNHLIAAKVALVPRTE
jgi:hypothetical protein